MAHDDGAGEEGDYAGEAEELAEEVGGVGGEEEQARLF